MDAETFLRSIGVPARFRKARLVDFGAEATYSIPLVSPNTDGLFITGDAGVGKTHLATAWLIQRTKEMATESRSLAGLALWLAVPDLLARLRVSYRGVGETENQILRECLDVPMLLMDDLGAEQSTDWTGQAIYRLINNRLNALQPTIITSNLTLEQLDKRDPRLASRLGGMAYQRLTGADRRLQRKV